VSNGLLLRADIHTLFDLDLLGIDPNSFKVVLAPPLDGTSYEALRGRTLNAPDDAALRPSVDALRVKWEGFSDSAEGL
jgi:hypothetical protein